VKIVLFGGSGNLGTALAIHHRAQGHAVTIIGRGGQNGVVPWDGRTLGPWAQALDGADLVINLAGRTVNCRYTPENQRAMLDSRVESAYIVGAAIRAATAPPRLWLQMSTATIYGHTYGPANTEDTAIGIDEPGASKRWQFSVEIAKAWEGALFDSDTPNTRKVALRAAMTMGIEPNGIFDTLCTLTRRGLGGSIAGGRQYMSWMHIADFLHAVDHVIDRPNLHGPVIFAAPNPVPQAEFMRDLRTALGVRIGLPAAAWMTSVGALFMNTETELVLKSRRVVPKRLIDTGFTFKYPNWAMAAPALVGAMRTARNSG
jgi:uncharacterized protein